MTEQRDNRYGSAGLALGLIAFVAALASEHPVVGVVALAGLVLAALGIRRAVRIDYGMSRSVSALLLALFALAVWVFSRGGSTAT